MSRHICAGTGRGATSSQSCITSRKSRRHWQNSMTPLNYARHEGTNLIRTDLEECGRCALRDECGGLFQSAAKKHSAHIKAFEGPMVSATATDVPFRAAPAE